MVIEARYDPEPNLVRQYDPGDVEGNAIREFGVIRLEAAPRPVFQPEA